MTETKLNLRQKLASIYTIVSHVEKYGENTKQHYHFVRAADVLHAIRKAFVEVGIYAQTNYTLLGTYDIKTNSGGTMHTATVRVEIILMDTESDETITISGVGDGADSGDKGIYKAMTGATKCALRNGFLVPDEADPEADQSVDNATSGQYEEPAPPPVPTRRARPEQRAEFAHDHAEVKTVMVPAANIPSSFDEIPESGITEAASPSMSAGQLPTDDELNAYRGRFVKFADDLKEAGFKPSKGPSGTITRKAIPYLLQVTGQTEVLAITKTQWDTFFEFVAKLQSLDDGPKQLVKLVNEAANAAKKEEEKQ